ncbi:hypothetical protein [Xenophilus sp. Marseille-Q4582]|uniref:hypothetical protein n=1 Tax=Xenophilus sp. Marseille-Q4582 TaxID=2866600 RepID=UPI001CE46602|nr:hypothetical protein [Xenophilus sp. Marseille-Q4582]
MDDVRDPNFAAWIEAERSAYEAVHRLHQSTQGGRLAPAPGAIAAVVALRRAANNRLALISHPGPPPARRPRPLVQRAAVNDSDGFAPPRTPPAAPHRVAL